MKDKANYPNPFTSSTSPTTCSLTCQATEGPCYSSQSVEVQDISYGYGGLPMRMYLQILDESCKPVPGAVVDVWHVAPTGKYSGDDSAHEDVAYCTGNNADFTSHLYFRGKQTTDANGVVFFDTCFPGWYSGRTVHIHLTISLNGTDYVTTQLVFDDALDDAIIATQPLYDARGPRDTTNTTDNVVGGTTDFTPYQLETKRLDDGAMLAWKSVIVRSSTATSLCTVAGQGGMGGPDGGMGGPPPDGGMFGPPPDGGP
jgi:protocatechuate 3,4-dioxygenase beta subunit